MKPERNDTTEKSGACPPHENPGLAPAAVISLACPRVDTVVCVANAMGCPKPSAASSGFVMTPMPMSSFPTHETAVVTTMAVLRCAGIPTMNATAASGRRMSHVVMRFPLNSMCILVQTNTTSSGWRIRQPMNPPCATSVTSVFDLEKTATGCGPAAISVGAAARRSDRSGEGNKAGAGYFSRPDSAQGRGLWGNAV